MQTLAACISPSSHFLKSIMIGIFPVRSTVSAKSFRGLCFCSQESGIASVSRISLLIIPGLVMSLKSVKLKIPLVAIF